MQQSIKFEDVVQDRPTPSGLDLLVTLRHFAIVTYAVDPARLSGLIPQRFHLDTVRIKGDEKALVSVVPFLDGNFTSAVRPFPSLKVGQTDYRAYVIDSVTGERCIWLFGTTLDSWLRVVPRVLWKLPCYRAKARFDCDYDSVTGLYNKYRMRSESRWAPADVEIFQSGDESTELAGFPDNETGLVVLTHPLVGFYRLRGGEIGKFCVWHEPLNMRQATLRQASFGLLDRLGLVTQVEQQKPHSVLVDSTAELTVYLPPATLKT